jgi:deoxyguanosine kinase
VPEALVQGSLIADYTFEKDALFARLNLQGDELDTYFRLHAALAERLVEPDLTVYLRVRTEVALQRIAQRDRPYERDMDADYIERLNRTYEEHFASAPRSILTVDTTSLDFVRNTEHLAQVAGRIRDALGIPPFQPALPLQQEPRR